MEPKIETEADSIGPLPAGYDDDRTDRDIFDSIERVLQDDLALRGESSSKQVGRKRRDWELLWPSFTEADATTIDSLTDVAAQGRLLKSLSRRAKELGGTHHTVDGRLANLLWGLRAAGLGAEHLQRIKKNLKTVKRATGYTEDRAKGYTMEEW
ncbi:MAG TPA: hypothetical protein EYO33_11005, partial [Phycisphaerales bacterium]|nr:hypothetical protein [Phycisphaerales bacterium]